MLAMNRAFGWMAMAGTLMPGHRDSEKVDSETLLTYLRC
jgi:hypothetical protein